MDMAIQRIFTMHGDKRWQDKLAAANIRRTWRLEQHLGLVDGLSASDAEHLIETLRIGMHDTRHVDEPITDEAPSTRASVLMYGVGASRVYARAPLLWQLFNAFLLTGMETDAGTPIHRGLASACRCFINGDTETCLAHLALPETFLSAPYLQNANHCALSALLRALLAGSQDTVRNAFSADLDGTACRARVDTLLDLLFHRPDHVERAVHDRWVFTAGLAQVLEQNGTARLHDFCDWLQFGSWRTGYDFRRASVEEALAHDILWHDTQSMGELARAIDDTPLGTAWIGERVDGDGLVLEHLPSAKDLAQEGHDMSHCVGSYDRRVKSGQSCIYRVNGRWRGTMELNMREGVPTMVQLRGSGNAPAPKDVERAVDLLVQNARTIS